MIKLKSSNFWILRERAKKDTHPFLHKYYYYRYKKLNEKFNAFIPLSTQIEGQPLLPHGIKGVHISKNAVIGKGCTIFHHCTIGSNTFGDSKHTGSPIIGDNVFIGAGAIIIGGIRIGDNVRIGAGCIVSDDIPDNATVVMPKPVVIEHSSYRCNKYKLIK